MFRHWAAAAAAGQYSGQCLYRTSQVVFQDIPGPFGGVFRDFPGLVWHVEVLFFLTRSTLPLQHNVMKCCTNYNVVFI